MQSVGEALGLGTSFPEALQKAFCALGRERRELGAAGDLRLKSLDDLLDLLAEPSSLRAHILYEALRRGADPVNLSHLTGFGVWFMVSGIQKVV